MHPRLRNLLEVLVFVAAVSLICIAIPVHAHTVECAGRSGIDLARCERHQQMAAQCGPLKGEAHLACDRDFLVAHPLDCKPLAGDDAKGCSAETTAVKRCEPKAGREFMRCVRDAIQASPMGTP